MRHLTATVATVALAFAGYRVVTFNIPDMPRMRPGQLVLARLNDTLDPYLPSAYFPLPAGAAPPALRAAEPTRPDGVRDAGTVVPAARPGELALLVEADDPLGRADAVGKTLDVIAPVGSGFTLDVATRRLLLVAGADRLAPLIALAHEASQKQIAVSLLVRGAGTGAQGAPDDAALAAWLSEMLPLDVEYQVAAELSSLLPELLGWADQLCAAGDSAMYGLLKESPGLKERMIPAGGRSPGSRAARDTGSGLPSGFAQVIVAPWMACGSGACQGCAVETVRGIRPACVDGPVFDLAELA